MAISGLYPEFDTRRGAYVSRCGRGGAPIRVAGNGAKVTAIPSPPTGGDRFAAPPGSDFEIRVDDGEKRRSYTVRCLPADFPQWRFEPVGDPSPGLFVVSFRATPREKAWVIVFDHEGVPRWWYSPETHVLWAQILSDGIVSLARSFGDGYGLDARMAHEIRSLSGDLIRLVRTRGSLTDGHELHELPNGNFLLASYAPDPRVELRTVAAWTKRRPPDRAAVVFAEIQEVGRGGRVAWRWNSRGRIALGETGRWWRSVLVNPKSSRFGETFDPVHINSIEPHGPNRLVISTRHTDAVYGIDRSSGRIIWKLGGKETAKSLRVIDDPAGKLFGGPHDARIGPDGRLTILDNGKGRPRLPRVVSYRLDLARGTATYLGQLTDPRVTSSHCC
ncbi:MAG TPA: aryl-sulfate sulfotransferase, partial [Solirubrobacterales bacterium]